MVCSFSDRWDYSLTTIASSFLFFDGNAEPSSVSRRGRGPVRSHRAGHHLPGSPSWCPQGGPKKASVYVAQAPTTGSGTSDTAASATASVAKKASEGQREEGRGASVHAAQASTVRSVASDSSADVPASVTKAASEGQGKDGRGGEERKQRPVRRAQGRATETSPPSSGGAAVSSPSRRAQGGATGTSPPSSVRGATSILSWRFQGRATGTSPPSSVGGAASSPSQ